jgi:sarcosine oxidase
MTFDVIVIGLGAVGSATAYHLSRKGSRVLGLDQFTPPHSLGSSHGQSRMIREAYYENPIYVPLVQRAYELWSELETETDQILLRPTGGLMIGPPDGALITGVLRSARNYHLGHELLQAHEVRYRYPALNPTDDMVAVWESRAGTLLPEKCIEAHLALAERQNATLIFGEAAITWKIDGDGVEVTTPKAKYRGSRLLIAAGPWTKKFVKDVSLPLIVERQVPFWFRALAHPEQFYPDRCPVYIWEYEPTHYLSGFPDYGKGIKIARHHDGEATEPDNVDRVVRHEDVEVIRKLIQRFIPNADGALLSATVCLYTNTPDHHFLIDSHPSYPQILIASPCSGHGFKFSSALGELLADLLIQGQTSFDLSLFKMERFNLV